MKKRIGKIAFYSLMIFFTISLVIGINGLIKGHIEWPTLKQVQDAILSCFW